MREVLRILQQHPERALDLQEKALDLAAQLIVICGLKEELSLGSETFDYTAPTEGELTGIDMKYLNMLARTLGAPGDA